MNEEKFSGKAIHYDKPRPAYSENLLDALYSDYGFASQAKIADIGSGTGIFTEQLLKRGSTVFGIEPNTDMREAGEKRLQEYKNFVSLDGDATNTKPSNSSIDIVTVAQALHWFPLDEFRRECKRILKPNGLVAVVYNERCNDFINEKINAAVARYCVSDSNRSGKAFIGANRKKINDLFHGEHIEIRKRNPLFMDKNKFLQYWLSRSYAPHEGDKSYEQFLHDLTVIFIEFSEDEQITIDEESVAYLGNISSL